LSKEDLAGRFGVFGIVPECSLAPFAAKVETLLDGITGANPFKPVREGGKVFDLLTLVFVLNNPAPAGHVRNQIASAEIIHTLEAHIHGATGPVHIIGTTFDCLQDFFAHIGGNGAIFRKDGANCSPIPIFTGLAT
tara:strand:- start:1928 stop:2335 length:408 start_codon:yes stop_codon:yes gene_type:complete